MSLRPLLDLGMRGGSIIATTGNQGTATLASRRPRGVMARSVADPGVEPAGLTARPGQRREAPIDEAVGVSATATAGQDRDGSPHRGPWTAATAFVSRDDRSPVPAPFSIPLPFEEHPIDLATALRLADAANPTIGAARTRFWKLWPISLPRGSCSFPHSTQA